jgi:2-dehydropantoate 2-reductase
MKIAVVGAGGVGGFFGGLLARSGADVTFLARGEHLRAMREHGLRVEAAAGAFTVHPARATDDPAAAGVADLALLCVKTYGLDGALERIQPLVGEHTALLTLQNGVEAPDQAAATFGAGRVLPGVVYSELAVRAPGVIFQGMPAARIVFGERDGAETPRALAIRDALAAAGIDVALSRNVLGALWAKCCFICAMSGVTTLARRPLGPLLADPEARELMAALMREAHAVGLAKGVRFDVDPVDAGMAAAEGFPYESKSSMLRDMERGARLEVEALNGAVVRLGRALGVPTPANHAVYAALRFAQPDKLTR